MDAFFLDVSSFVFNTANGLIEGLNLGQGNVLMHKELAAAMPGVVFSGESLHEVTFFRESFAQRWKPATMGPTRRSIPHPISSFLFSPYTVPLRIFRHCLTLIGVQNFTKSIWIRMRFGAFCPRLRSGQYLTWDLNG